MLNVSDENSRTDLRRNRVSSSETGPSVRGLGSDVTMATLTSVGVCSGELTIPHADEPITIPTSMNTNMDLMMGH